MKIIITTVIDTNEDHFKAYCADVDSPEHGNYGIGIQLLEKGHAQLSCESPDDKTLKASTTWRVIQ